MEFNELIRTRASVRSYDPDKKIPSEVLKGILESGRLAPSAANRQPWTFHLVSSKAGLARIRECYQQSWFRQAPYVLAVSGRKNEAWTRHSDGYCAVETDLTIAMDHLILAAANEGIGSCWIAAFSPEVLRKALNLNEDDVVFAITPLGYPGKGYTLKEEKQRKNLEDVVRYH